MTRGRFATLTRFFVSVLLAPPLLTDLGADYLRRTVASLVAMVLVAGIFLTRVFFRKYADLGGLTYPDAYLRALQSDTLLMIAVPMVIVGLVAIVLCPLLFPDETDYHVLTPLPVGRNTIFAARLAAVAIAGAIIVLTGSAISSFWFPLATGGRRAPHPALARVMAHAVATVSGSAWMFSAVAAFQGASLVLIPAARRRLGLILQAGMIVVIVGSVPFITRLPATTISPDTVTTWPLVAFPATWFFGLEQWLLQPDRSDGYGLMAGYAIRAFTVSIAAILICFAVLYRTAERLAGLTHRSDGVVRPSRLALDRRFRMRPAAAGVIEFAIASLARSRLHQFVFVMVTGCGIAILSGQVATAMTGASPAQSRTAEQAALAAPLLTSLALTLALRAAFLLPIDRGAAWAFRLTEGPAVRKAALDAVVWCFMALVVTSSFVVAAVVQPVLFGSIWLVSAALTAIASLGLIEAGLSDWNRIPFTCSYLPGKRVLAYNLGVLLGAYFVFVYLGAHMIRWGITSVPHIIVVAALLSGGTLLMRRARLATWGVSALDFDDYDPTAVRTLGLLPDEH
jgi:hypothetical protein